MRDITILDESPNLELAALVTAAGFVQPLTPELQLDVEQHLAEGRQVYSVRHQGKLGGYAIFRVVGPVLYLGGVMLSPELQGLGLAGRIIERARHDTKLDFLGLRTQSLRMWAAGQRTSTCWIPSSTNDSHLIDLGHDLAAALNCRFPVHRGFYGAALYGQKPVHHDAALQSWWDSFCNFERGDAVICVGKLR